MGDGDEWGSHHGACRIWQGMGPGRTATGGAGEASWGGTSLFIFSIPEACKSLAFVCVHTSMIIMVGHYELLLLTCTNVLFYCSLIFPGVRLGADSQFSDFLDGLGPAQLVGRQTLATPAMGKNIVFSCVRKMTSHCSKCSPGGLHLVGQVACS